ncbi:MAG TPA: outer membrane beta-barrel protein [Holophagaceae bacterium]|nr:outer membrane beta-barrel protein [Holophagaceae bacterium]
MNARTLMHLLAAASFTCAASAQGASAWTGWYLGFNGGYGTGKSNVTTAAVYDGFGYFAASSVDSINATGSGSVKPKGGLGGLTFGYNTQVGGTVYGFEFDADAAGLKGDRSETVVYPGFAPATYTLSQTTKATAILTLRGRIGYVDGDNLWFGTLGLTSASIKIEDSFSDTYASAAEGASKAKNRLGWILGGGYERALPNRWTFKAEVLYADFGKVSVGGGTFTYSVPPQPYPNTSINHSADLKAGLVRIGFNYRF